MRYDGLVEPKTAIAVLASDEKSLISFFEKCRYPPPVKTGSVLCAESQQNIHSELHRVAFLT